jgi:hypothetical protein
MQCRALYQDKTKRFGLQFVYYFVGGRPRRDKLS